MNYTYSMQIPGSFTAINMAALYDVAIKEGIDTIVEVGVDQGRSASVLLQVARKTGAKVILIDNWQSLLIENMFKVQARLIKDFSDVKYEVLYANSEEASKFVPAPIDLVHIDANHYDDSPGNDCKVWLPKLRSGGIAAFHDYGSNFTAVTEAVDEYTKGWEDLGVHESLAIRRKP